MSNYVITKYSYDRAKKVGLLIKQSKNPLKKIDVYKNSIGDSLYMDYPNYMITFNLQYADERRK